MRDRTHAPFLGRGALRLLRLLFFSFFSFFLVTGKVDRWPEVARFSFFLGALFWVGAVVESGRVCFFRKRREEDFFWLGWWGLLILRWSLQVSAGHGLDFYPLVYLFFSLVGLGVGAGSGLVLVFLFLILEALWFWLSGSRAGWASLVGHGGFLALFWGAGFLLGRWSQKVVARAQRQLVSMEEKLSEFQRDDTVQRLSGLSEGGREKAALRWVSALDQTLATTLETGRQLLACQTLALYWRPHPGGPARLREAATLVPELKREADLLPGAGLLGQLLENNQPLRVSGSRRLKNCIPHYNSGQRPDHLLALPFGQAGEFQGLLVADRRGREPFSESEERLLSLLAQEVMQAHEHALLLRRLEAEASQFKSLAELSHRLSRSLALSDMLSAIIRVSGAIAGHDAMVVVLPAEDSGEPVVMAAGGECGEEKVGTPVSVVGTLAGWVMSEKQYLVIPDLRERTVKTPVLGRGLDPPEMRSALIHPLPLRNHTRGALVFFGREKEAFSAYVVRATGILADLVAVAIQNALLYRETERRATHDGLTGLHNHRWFQERLAEELARASRLGSPLSLLLCDLDHFKRINDTYGHPVGDQVLKSVAQTLRASLRQVDAAARYGGEEFVVILVGTAERGALEFAERIRKKIARLRFSGSEKEFQITLSLGIAVFPDDGRTREELISAADQALYQAKRSGRNRVVTVSSLSPAPQAASG